MRGVYVMDAVCLPVLPVLPVSRGLPGHLRN